MDYNRLRGFIDLATLTVTAAQWLGKDDVTVQVAFQRESHRLDFDLPPYDAEVLVCKLVAALALGAAREHGLQWEDMQISEFRIFTTNGVDTHSTIEGAVTGPGIRREFSVTFV